MMLHLKTQLETNKQKNLCFLFPEDICAFAVKGNFCVLEVQPS